jgi:hypothetical protein
MELSRSAEVYREPEAMRFAARGSVSRYPSPAVTGTIKNVIRQIVATEQAGHTDDAGG